MSRIRTAGGSIDKERTITMKKWLITPLLGGLLLSGTLAPAQQNGPPAPEAVQAGGESGGIQVQGSSSGGAIVAAGGGMAAAKEDPAPPPGAVIRGRFLSGPDGEMHPVVTAGAVAAAGGARLPPSMAEPRRSPSAAYRARRRFPRRRCECRTSEAVRCGFLPGNGHHGRQGRKDGLPRRRHDSGHGHAPLAIEAQSGAGR